MAAIQVLTKPACVQCNQTKKYLDKMGVEYDIIDPSVDMAAWEKALEEGKAEGFRSAPIVFTPKGNWSGFRPDMLDTLVP